MATTDIEPSELTKWDPGLTERVMGIMRPFLKRYFRSEVRGLENLPPGGALLVSNHSGGMLPMDVPILSADFYQKHGYNRPLYTLSHDMLGVGPTGDFFKKTRTVSDHHFVEDAIMASEIEQLPDLSGFLKLASRPHWQRVTFARNAG